MQIVIDIPEEEYAAICYNVLNEREHSYGYVAIANGKPLPKGHGRLKDADAIAARFKENKKFYVDSYGGFFQFMPIEYKARCDEIDSCWADVVNVPTIIEADKECDDDCEHCEWATCPKEVDE